MKATAPFSLKHNASNRNNKSYFCQGDMFYNCKAFAAKKCSHAAEHQVGSPKHKILSVMKKFKRKTIATDMSSVHFCKIMAVVQTQRWNQEAW
jgi:hypothetical protein